MEHRNRNWEDRSAREAEWNRERERRAAQAARPDWSQYGGPWEYEGRPENGAWREGFRGGFGNSGQLSRAAYDLGGVGAAYDGPPQSWRGAGGNEFGTRGGWFERPAYRGEYRDRDYHGSPGFEPRFGGRAYEGTWAERAYGARGQSGGFTGHDYDWTTRGERAANQEGGWGVPPVERERSHEGPYTGKGPQGYQRSDERVYEDVCDRLTENGHLDASNIRVQIEKGEVTLEGTVMDRRSKRLAEEIAESARGVRDIHNRLRVETA